MNLITKTDNMNLNVVSLEKIRRRNDIDKNTLVVCHEALSVPRLDSLCDDVTTLTQKVRHLLPARNIIKISKFIHSYTRVRLGKETFSTNSYRSGTSRDMYVLPRYTSSPTTYQIRPAKIMKIFDVSVTLLNDEKEYSFENVTFVSLHWFKEHPLKNFYGVNCPMKIWSTTVEVNDETKFVYINFITKKCTVTKSKGNFNNLPVDDVLLQAHKFDTVYFIT